MDCTMKAIGEVSEGFVPSHRAEVSITGTWHMAHLRGDL